MDDMENKAVELTEVSVPKTNNGALQLDPTPYYFQAKTQDEIYREAFPKFKELPAELRIKIWKYAVPAERTPLSSTDERRVYRLEPAPRYQRDAKLRMRLDTIRGIQRTCSEAAAEVQKAFPNTIKCTSGMLRFNAEQDLFSLSIHEDALFYERIHLYGQGAVIFEDDWHTIPRKLIMHSHALWQAFSKIYNIVCSMLQNPSAYFYQPVTQSLQGFMSFLGDCINLRVFGFTHHAEFLNYQMNCAIMHRELQTWLKPLAGDWQLPYFHEELRADLASRYPGPVKQGLFYRSKLRSGYNASVVSGIEGLEMLIRGIPSDTVPSPALQRMRSGHKELQHLRLLLTIPLKHEVYTLQVMLGQGQE